MHLRILCALRTQMRGFKTHVVCRLVISVNAMDVRE